MAERTAEAVATADAPSSVVWRLLADVATWPAWGTFDTAALESPGPTVSEGVGAVRILTSGRYTTRERVLAFEANRRLSYSLLSGLPLRDYVGEVVLREVDGRTEITWRSRFHPKIPGTGRMFARGINRLLDDLSTRLAKAAESAVHATN